MNIELHLSGLSAAQVAAIGLILDGGSGAAPATKPVTTKAETTKAETTKAETTKAETTKAETTKPAADEVTIETITEQAKIYTGKNGRDAFVELLGNFGAKNISGVPVEQRASLLAKLEA